MPTMKMMKTPNNFTPPKLCNVKPFRYTEKGLRLDTYETQGNL